MNKYNKYILLLILIFPIVALSVVKPGTIISNSAFAEYLDNSGVLYISRSNSVHTMVLPSPAFEILPDGEIKSPAQIVSCESGKSAVLYYSVKNTGNVPLSLTFSLFDAQEGISYEWEIYADFNGNGVGESDEKIDIDLDIDPGNEIPLIVFVKVPESFEEGESLYPNIVGVSRKFSLEDRNNVSKIFIEDGSVSIKKSIEYTVIAPGEKEKFTIEITNNNSYAISGIVLEEFVDFAGYSEGAVLLPSSIKASQTFEITYFDGESWNPFYPGSDEKIKGFRLSIDGLEPFQNLTVSFEVNFPESSKRGQKRNEAFLTYTDDHGSKKTIKSNTVSYFVEGQPEIWIGPAGKPEVLELGSEDLTEAATDVFQDTHYLFLNTIKNSGNTAAIVNLKVESANFDTGDWVIFFTDYLGNPLPDTDNDGFQDIGTLNPGSVFTVGVYVQPPEGLFGDNEGEGWKMLIKAFNDLWAIKNRTYDVIPEILEKKEIKISKEIMGDQIITPGGTITYRISVRNETGYPLSQVTITDELSEYLIDVFDFILPAGAEYSISGRTLIIELPDLGVGQSSEIIFSAKVDSDAKEGTLIKNSSTVTGIHNDEVFKGTSNEVHATVVNASLMITKEASPLFVEPGDRIHYIVKTFNISSYATVTGLEIVDILPAGTNYIPGTARLNGERIEVIYESAQLKIENISIAPLGNVTLEYDLELISGSVEELVNKVTARGFFAASGVSGSLYATSNAAISRIEVKQSFDRHSGIVGRIYVDENNNGYFDNEDSTVENVRIFLEDGHFTVSDREGRFSFKSIKPGIHIVKVDIDHTDYELDAIQDHASLKNQRSFMLAVPAGFYKLMEIRLKPLNFSNGNIEFKESERDAISSSSFILGGGILTNTEPEIKIDFLRPGDVEEFVGKDSIQVEVRIPSEASAKLLINGSEIPDTKIGSIAENIEKGYKDITYFNVKLQKGWNDLTLKAYSSEGNASKNISVYLSGNPASISLSSSPTVIFADGVTQPELIFEVVDDNGIRSSVGGELIVSGIEPEMLSGIDSSGKNISVNLKNGRAVLKLRSFIRAQTLNLEVTFGSITKEFSIEVSPLYDDLMLSGFGDILYSGKLSIDGRLFGMIPFENGLFSFRFGTSQMDDLLYMEYGDESYLKDLTPSSKSLFLRYETAKFNIQLGDYYFYNSFGGDEAYSDNGYGISSEFIGSNSGFSYRLFVKPREFERVTDELPGKGVRGVYYLKSNQIVENSESVMILAKDKEGHIINERKVSKEDYFIDYERGFLIFDYPVPAFDEDFNDIFINISYLIENPTGNLDLMAQSSFMLGKNEIEFTGIARSFLSEPDVLLAVKTRNGISPALSLDSKFGVSYKNSIGLNLTEKVNFTGNLLSGHFTLELSDNYITPLKPSPSSAIDIETSINQIDNGLMYKFSYLRDYNKGFSKFETSLGGTQDLVNGNLDYALSYLGWNYHGGSYNNEIRLTLSPNISTERAVFSGEAYAGFLGTGPTLGGNFNISGHITKDISLSGELNASLGDPSGNLSDFSLQLKKDFGDVSFYLKGKWGVLPETYFKYFMGFRHSKENRDIYLNFEKSNSAIVSGGYSTELKLPNTDMELSYEGKHSLDASFTNTFDSFHFAIKNREVENLKASLDLDIGFKGDLDLESLLLQSRASYSGFDIIYPHFEQFYAVSPETERYNMKAGIALRPKGDNYYFSLFQLNHDFEKNNNLILRETSLNFDLVGYGKDEYEISYSFDAYFKPQKSYFATGYTLKKWLGDLSLSTSFNVAFNNSLKGFWRMLIEAGYNILPDLEAYIGYGFGTLEESFLGDLKKNGFYSGIRFKIDDSWLVKNDKRKVSFLFFEDTNGNRIMDTGENPVKVSFKIDGTSYSADGETLIELEPGSHTMDLISIPENLQPAFKYPFLFDVKKVVEQEILLPFEKKPAIINIMVFEDTNRNGRKDNEENFIKAFSVSTENEIYSTVDSMIKLYVSEGWKKISLDLSSFGENTVLTTGNFSEDFRAVSGEEKTVYFGIYFASELKVRVFEDTNGNGIFDPDEPLSAVPVFLDIAGRPYTVSLESTIKGVPLGDIKPYVSLGKENNDYVLTTEFQSISTVTDRVLDIGLARAPSLKIVLFIDENNNGIMDNNEAFFNEVVNVILIEKNLKLPAFGYLELGNLKPGKVSFMIKDLPEGFLVERSLVELELKPNQKEEVYIAVVKK